MIVRPFSVLTSFTTQDSLPIGASSYKELLVAFWSMKQKIAYVNVKAKSMEIVAWFYMNGQSIKLNFLPVSLPLPNLQIPRIFPINQSFFAPRFISLLKNKQRKKKCKSYRWLSCLKIPLKRLQWKVGVSYSLQSSRWKYFWQRGSDAKYVRFISKRHLKK